MSRLAVIVPATDGPPTLGRCLEAIRASHEPPEEIVVVEDPALRTPAAARNAGVRRTGAPLLAFVDADVVVHPGALGRLRAALEAPGAPAAVFGAYDDDPGAPGAVSGFRFLLHHAVHVAGAGEASTFWAGLGAVRREPFERVRGFDGERRWLEDVDLGLRLHLAGERLLLDPEIRGTHLKRLRAAEMLRSDALERGAPWTDLLLRHRAGGDALNLGARHRALTALALAVPAALLARRPVLAAGALAGFAALDAPFLSLVARRRGPAQAAAALPLHVAHQIAGLAGAAAGAGAWVRAGRPRGASGTLEPGQASAR